MTQCTALTRKKERCKRPSLDGQEYCYWHSKGIFNKITYTLAEILGVKRRALVWVVIFSIIIWFASSTATHKLDLVLTELEKKPNVDAVLVPYVQNAPEGDYLPVVVSNSGDITLHNLFIGVRDCVSGLNNSFETHEVPYILSNKEFIIRFGNKETIKSFERLWCTPSSDFPYPSIEFNLSRKNNTPRTSTTTTCGYCNYEIAIHSDEFEKIINGSYRAPIDIIMSASIIS